MLTQKYAVTVEGLNIVISTGDLAKLTNGSVTIQLGETSVFVSVAVSKTVAPGQDFFPLTVDYREKFAAGGRFPGGYFKREGRPSEKEILTSRLCDRPLRPLFDKAFIHEVQVVGMLLSTDQTNEPDVLMVNAASAALMCSDIPWNGPIGCIRLGEIQGKFIINPTNEQIFESSLDLIYVGNEQDMLMIEGSADQVSEERFIEALEFAHQSIQPIIEAQKKLAALVNKPKKTFSSFSIDPTLSNLIQKFIGNQFNEILFTPSKESRNEAVSDLYNRLLENLKESVGECEFDEKQVSVIFDKIQEAAYRDNILNEGKRVDGRGERDLRPISCSTGNVPRVHGSAIFERGETQTLVLTTLGTSKDAQELDALTGGAQSKSFLLHYNFPPFSVGETGRLNATSRREVGHGALAERSLLPIIPSEDDFPYSIRIVSEIMASNGSTSMATVCGGCLALMDAGVPVSDIVAGISVGLVTRTDENNQSVVAYKVITDIIGAEDHFGDMDFKIAGTRTGITGFQLDLKIAGLPFHIAKEAIYQNREARLQIIDVMSSVLSQPRADLREYAPRIEKMQIDPEKIGALIGPGGKNIKRITETSGAQIDINEDNSGRLIVYSNNETSLRRAIEQIELMTGEIKPGKTYRAIVRSIKEFGVFAECLPGQEGLVHISELSDKRVNKAEDVCKLGDEIIVKCIGKDEKGRVRLSRRAVLCEAQGITYEPNERSENRSHSKDRFRDSKDRFRDSKDRFRDSKDRSRDSKDRSRDSKDRSRDDVTIRRVKRTHN